MDGAAGAIKLCVTAGNDGITVCSAVSTLMDSPSGDAALQLVRSSLQGLANDPKELGQWQETFRRKHFGEICDSTRLQFACLAHKDSSPSKNDRIGANKGTIRSSALDKDSHLQSM